MEPYSFYAVCTSSGRFVPLSSSTLTASTDAPADVGEAERLTGVARATLRIWERRYGFPNPRRNRRGERFYDEAEIEKLRWIGQLVARGWRPGRLVDLSSEALQKMADEAATSPGRYGNEPLIVLLRQLDATALSGWLLQQLTALGLRRFVLEVVPASNRLVGEAWNCGELQIHEEHLYSECLQQVLRTAIAAVPPPARGARRVLLATLPREHHGFGLLMVQALMASQGWACLPLGVNVPGLSVAAAAKDWKPDVIALSFSRAYSARDLLSGLAELRALVPLPVEIWLGGACAGLTRPELTALPGLRRLAELPMLEAALAEMRGPGATAPVSADPTLSS